MAPAQLYCSHELTEAKRHVDPKRVNNAVFSVYEQLFSSQGNASDHVQFLEGFQQLEKVPYHGFCPGTLLGQLGHSHILSIHTLRGASTSSVLGAQAVFFSKLSGILTSKFMSACSCKYDVTLG